MNINAFSVNGREKNARSDGRVDLSLWTEGAVNTVRFTLLEGSKTLWDSGALAHVGEYSFDDLPLSPCAAYTVRARVTGGGETAEASVPLCTGRMGTPWLARWIEPEQENAVPEPEVDFMALVIPGPHQLGGHGRLRPAQELRRVFRLDRLPGRAMLYATAHGVYTLFLNGARVDPRRLAPETTPYEQMLCYQCYDLTALLREGENELRVLLGDGWWIGRLGFGGHSCQYGDRLGFLGQLELEFDGEKEYIVTDEGFESRPSHIRYSDLMMGEKWDLAAPAAPWTPCRVTETGTENLVLQTVEPLGVWEEVEPAALFTDPNGELVADFGKVMAGVVEVELTCPAGRVVQIDHCEALDAAGSFFRNITGRNKDQENTVVCGGGETRFCPEFTYQGFRYARIRGASREEIASLRALAVATPIRAVGDFHCDHRGLEQLQKNILQSARSNMASVPTDCPQREKAGWTGDIHAFAATGCFDFDLRGFLSAWLGQMRVSQEEDGGIPIVIPSYPEQTKMQYRTNGNNTSAAWSDACVSIPLRLYRAYGDRRVLRDNLPMMERWMEYVAAHAPGYLWTEGYHFGDWLIPSFENDIHGGTAATASVIGACQYAVTTAELIEVLEALDEGEEKIGAYRTLLENIRAAIRAAFVREDGRVEGDLQGLYVMVLKSGAARGELGRRVAGRLADKIRENGGGLDTGFVSTPHLLDMLCENGYEDLAWQLLFRTEAPSWLYAVERGATSIWENWNAIRPDGTVTASSFNHYALGAVGDWIYRSAGGLRRAAPGWRRAEIAPNIHCGLQWAECTRLTHFGLLSCRWERTEGKTEVAVTVPHGVTVSVTLPGVKVEAGAGVHRFTV